MSGIFLKNELTSSWILALLHELCYSALWREKYIFLCLPLFVPLIRGSLDYARDDGTRSVVFYKEGRPFQEILRVIQTLWMTGLRWRWRFFWGGIVISTKWNAWRNPLRRSKATQWNPSSTGDIHYLWWSLRCKWSFPTESEVCLRQVKFHQRWSCGDKSISSYHTSVARGEIP